MNNVDELYKKYYNAYKNDYDTDDELTEDKKKKYDYKQFKIDNKLILPKRIKVSEKRFNEMLSTITEAKNNGLKADVDGREIILDNTDNLLKDVYNRKINGNEFKEKYNNIVDGVEKILNRPMLTKNQEKMVRIISLLGEILKSKNKKTNEKKDEESTLKNEQQDTTDMLELESEESAAQRRNQNGRSLKTLTSSHMLSGLPISLAQEIIQKSLKGMELIFFFLKFRLIFLHRLDPERISPRIPKYP